MVTRAVVLLLALAPAIAVAKPKPRPKPNPKVEAKRHVAKATVLKKKGKRDQALVELQAAVELDPKPEWLRQTADLEVELDQCAAAIGHYWHYLESHPKPDAEASAQAAIDACRAKMEPKPSVQLTPEPEKPAPEKLPPPPPPKPRPFYSDKLGDTFVVAGVAAGVVAAIEYRGATSDLDQATTGTYDHRSALVDDAHTKRLYSVILAGAAVSLVTVGIARYRWHDRGTERAVAIVPTANGFAITGSF